MLIAKRWSPAQRELADQFLRDERRGRGREPHVEPFEVPKRDQLHQVRALGGIAAGQSPRAGPSLPRTSARVGMPLRPELPAIAFGRARTPDSADRRDRRPESFPNSDEGSIVVFHVSRLERSKGRTREEFGEIPRSCALGPRRTCAARECARRLLRDSGRGESSSRGRRRALPQGLLELAPILEAALGELRVQLRVCRSVENAEQPRPLGTVVMFREVLVGRLEIEKSDDLTSSSATAALDRVEPAPSERQELTHLAVLSGVELGPKSGTEMAARRR